MFCERVCRLRMRLAREVAVCRTGGTTMRKSVLLGTLTFTALASVTSESFSYPISTGQAQRCGHWQTGDAGTITCAWCEYGRGRKSVCHWIACDSTGCEQVDIAERKMPPTRLRARPIR